MVLVPIDLIMLIVSAIVVYYLRFSSTLVEIRPIVFELSFSKYFLLVISIIPFWLFIFALAGLYDFRPRRLINDFYRIFLGVSAGMTALIILIFFRHELFASRFLVVANWLIAIVCVTLGRLLLRFVKNFLYQYNYGLRRVILIGNNSTCASLVSHFQSSPKTGFKVVNHFKEIGKEELKKLNWSLSKRKVDEIINCDPTLAKNVTEKLVEMAEDFKIDYKYVPDFFETKATNMTVDTLVGIPIVAIKRTSLDGWGQILKRVIDIFVSICVLVICFPLFCLIALMIKIDSPGPILYRNRRIGFKGRNINVLKFRSMKVDYCTGDGYGGNKALEIERKLIRERSVRKGPIYKVLNDPRRTKVGRFLEKTSFDELPQLINVLRGEMSLIGPRPHQLREVEKYDKRHRRVFVVKPGMTGLAQISGRSDLDFENEFKLDMYYLENWSIGMDFQILLKTPLALLKRRNFS